MRDFDVWDVVKVPFPYTNRPVQQYRPALVVGRYEGSGAPTLLWVIMITSADHRRWIGDIDISDQVTAGLPSASIVRSAKIATIEAGDADRLGVLAISDRREVRKRLAATLELSLKQ
jgi:mRNA interferase MazF